MHRYGLKKKEMYEWKHTYWIVLAVEIEDRRCEWKGRRISRSRVKRSSYLGRTGNSACWFIQPHYAGQGPYRAFFIPLHFQRVALKSQLHGLREREKEHLLWRFLRIGRFIPVRLFAGTEGGKMDWSSERRESARQRDQCLSATQRARKK